MRKLTTFCCLTAALSTSFLGCQKNDSLEFIPSPSPPQFPYGMTNQVSAQTIQSFDYQHLTSHLSLNLPAQPTPTLNNAARFVLTYFNLFEEEKEKIYTSSDLKTNLLAAGLTEKEAQRRTDRIFVTMHCSPSYLTETARLISPTLPSHTEGAFICTLYKPYDVSELETFSENAARNNVSRVLYKKTSLTENIKEVNKLVGVSGSVAVQGSNQIQLYFADNEPNTSFSRRFEPQEIRLVLQSTRGYTVGEAMYIKLILGQLTEQEAWLLFEKEIIPELIKNNKISTNMPLSRIDFRYNYVEIIGDTGRLGHTIYDLAGFTDLKTAF